jgi:hypothetical protein
MKKIETNPHRVHSPFQTNPSHVPYMPVATGFPHRDTLAFSKAEQHAGSGCIAGCLQGICTLIASICKCICNCFSSGPKTKEVVEPELTLISQETSYTEKGEWFQQMGSLIEKVFHRFRGFYLLKSEAHHINPILTQERRAALIIKGPDGERYSSSGAFDSQVTMTKFLFGIFPAIKDWSESYSGAPLKDQTFTITLLVLVDEPTSDDKQTVYSWSSKSTVTLSEKTNELGATNVADHHCLVASKEVARNYINQRFTSFDANFASGFIQPTEGLK